MHRRPAAAPTVPLPTDRLVAGILAATVAASMLVVDVRAESPFDAPKRLAAAIGCAAAAALVFSRPRARRDTVSRTGIAAAALFGLSIGLAAVSALSSPRRAAAVDAWRWVGVISLSVPLGASAAFEGGRRAVTTVFLAAAAVSAVLALGEAAGWRLPLPVVEVGGRSGTGALLGNEGLLAIVLALAAVRALAVALASSRPRDRRRAWAVLLLLAAALVVDRNLTAVAAAVAGGAIVSFGFFGRRAARGAAIAVAAAAIAVVLYAPSRARVREAAAYARAGDWDRLSSFRAGPWMAAIEMIRERPILGFGPGTFAAEYVPSRLQGEIRLRRRLVNPVRGSAYAETHCDYLQAAAEAGIPAAAAALAAFALVLGGLRGRGDEPGSPRPERIALAAMLCAGAISALTWFPLQRPASSIPLLLAAGRAWRISGSAEVAA